MRRQLGEFCAYLEQPDVIEISLNPDGQVWIDRLGQQMRPVGTMSASAAESFIGTVASINHTTVTREQPTLECEMPINGGRFEAVIPPIVPASIFSIRCKASAIYTLAQYVADGVISDHQKYVIESSLETR